ncbi:hypothetical protein JCM10908_004811 [Rhodotorula pacifica]|uniref:uncharacterized protein n=1 Tax=Rhodotorula pacifica TaxID=1495444 RepID=UPI0031743766
MFHPTRGGTRGGQGDFKWSDVAADKDREYYLGHSLRAPVGRWQNGKDLTWYNKEGGDDADARERERQEELKRIKEAEEDALAQALGFAPTPRAPAVSATPSVSSSTDPNAAILEKARRKAEMRAEHEARKAERQRIREERAARHRSGREDREGSARSYDSHQREKQRTRSRSRSPGRRRDEPYYRDERDRRSPVSRHDEREHAARPHSDRPRAYDTGDYDGRDRAKSPRRYDARERRRPERHVDNYEREDRYRSRDAGDRRIREEDLGSRSYVKEEEPPYEGGSLSTPSTYRRSGLVRSPLLVVLLALVLLPSFASAFFEQFFQQQHAQQQQAQRPPTWDEQLESGEPP